jgi:uncharacterized protein YndB with AHSA1/START domain
MTLVAQFPVTVERLWEAFTQPAQLERFWGPPGWPARFTDHDFTVGGIASYHMTSPQGERAGGRWEFLAIDAPRSFEVVDAFIGDDGAVNTELPSMRMTFEFREAEGGAELRNTTYFPTVDGPGAGRGDGCRRRGHHGLQSVGSRSAGTAGVRARARAHRWSCSPVRT